MSPFPAEGIKYKQKDKKAKQKSQKNLFGANTGNKKF